MDVTQINKKDGSTTTISLDEAANSAHAALGVSRSTARKRIVGTYQVETAFFIYRAVREPGEKESV